MAQMMGLRRTSFEAPGGVSVVRTLPGVCRRCNRTQLVQIHSRRFPVVVPAALVLLAAALVVTTWDASRVAEGFVGWTAALKVLLTGGAWFTLFARRSRAQCPACDLGQVESVAIEDTTNRPERRLKEVKPLRSDSVLGLTARPVNQLRPADLDLDLSFLDKELDQTDPPKS